MTYLFILNDHPFETERDFNGLRLATAMAEDESNTVNVALFGDAVFCAVAARPPEGRDDVPSMLARFAEGRRRVVACRTCMERRGIAETALIPDVSSSTLGEVAQWTTEADRVLVF
jgi:uncharacterized protein involved in oxidation of intracellular sulfur